MLRGTVLVLLSACCFGTISPLTVIATARGMPLQNVQAVRYVTAALVLLLIARFTRPAAPASSAARLSSPAVASLRTAMAPWWHPRLLLIAGGGQALIATLALLPLRWIPAASASFLFFTFPAWVAVFSALRGVEALDVRRVAALLLALGGITFMIGAPDAAARHPVGVSIALLAAVVYALFIPVLGALQRGRDPVNVSRSITVGGSIVFVAWALGTGTLFTAPDALALAAGLLQGIFSVGAFIGFLAGLTVLGAVRTAITSTIEPFWTLLLGMLLLNQPIGVGTLVGGAAIMGAVLLLQHAPVSALRPRSSSAQT